MEGRFFSGVVQEPCGYAYTAWGESVNKADGSSAIPGAFGYGAKYGYWRDGESGFYMCTYRSYDPGSGRFITRDPIGFNGGPNLYGYAGNDPVNLSDPSGKNPFLLGALAVVGIYTLFVNQPANAPGLHDNTYTRSERFIPFDPMGEPQMTMPWHTSYFGPAHLGGYDGYTFTTEERRSYQYHEQMHRCQSTWDLSFNKPWAEIDAYQKQIKELKRRYKASPDDSARKTNFMSGEYDNMHMYEQQWKVRQDRQRLLSGLLSHYW